MCITEKTFNIAFVKIHEHVVWIFSVLRLPACNNNDAKVGKTYLGLVYRSAIIRLIIANVNVSLKIEI